MNFINDFIFTLTIHLTSSYSFFRISNYKNLKKLQMFFIIALAIFLSSLQVIFNIPIPFKLFLICLIYSLIFEKVTHISFENCFVIKLTSLTLSLISITISSAISLFFVMLTKHTPENHIFFICDFIFSSFITYRIFKIKRLKSGFPFLKKLKENFYLSIFILILTAFIIFTYFILAGFTNISIQTLFFSFLLFTTLMIIIIQKTFVMYQKQKLQLQALKDYEQELSETKQKLETAIQEKEMIVKSNHEFYHRQEALNKKLDLLIHTQADSMNTEFGKDYSDIVDRLTTLSNEYNEKTSSAPNITKSNITEIDDMLTYMQSECLNNNIEFILKIDCDINHIITNFITKSQLETLLGDLIRNAIIAINHSSNTYRSIMVVFGIKDDAYELCILDSGIPFEAETLINLGINKASTHLDEGGSGIGFITTFETINSCGASFIVNEITNNNYTKSLEIKFDDRHEYIIISNRKDQLKEMNNINRDIILK